MRRLAIFVIRRRWLVLIGVLIALPAFALYGGKVHDKLSTGGFTDPGAESSRAAAEIARLFPKASQSDFVVVVTARSGTVNDATVKAAGTALTAKLAHDAGVLDSASYWTLDEPAQLRSRDSRQALIFASLRGNDDERLKTAARLSPQFSTDGTVVATAVTGRVEVTRQLADEAQKDLQKSELLTAPLTFIALVIVFGSAVAAGLPLAVGIIAVLGTFAVLTLLTLFTDVSVFALNLTTGMGLGLSIDYSLFIVTRYREELRNGVSTNVAVGRSMQTAGRTVAFSAGTVAVSIAVLALFPMAYLRSFAFAGVAVVALAGIAAVIVLPAVLAILGPRVEKGRILKTRADPENRFWHRQAVRVMHRPILYAVSVTLLLCALAIPFFHITPGLADDRVGPKSMSSRQATDSIRHNFASREADALSVLIEGVNPTTDRDAIDRFARALAGTRGVARVDGASGYFLPTAGKVVAVPASAAAPGLAARFTSTSATDATFLSVVPDVEPYSKEGVRLVDDIRATPAPFHFLVAGTSAELVDTRHAVFARLPLVLGIIAIATFVLLFFMTGSLVVPVKALFLNVLSLTATFGATVWIFQEGHLSHLLDFTPSGTIDVFTPILMFCIAFGTSMDYEVFLLSRIKEEYDLERDNEHAVAEGLAKTGRLVTAAALLLMIVFVGIAVSGVQLLKIFGVGLALAVIVDAFLIRTMLLPAFMRLAGRVNWWSPKWLRQWHLRFGLWENEPIAILDREFEATT